MTFIFFLVLDLFHRLSFAIGLVVFLSRCRPPFVSEPPGGEFPAEGFHIAFTLGEATSCVSICALPILDCGVVRPGVSVVSVDFLLIIHIKGNDKGDYLHVDVLVEIGMHPCGFPIPDRDVVPAYMFGILRAESGEVGGEVLPETAVKRRFASKQARCRRRKFGIEADVDRQCPFGVAGGVHRDRFQFLRIGIDVLTVGFEALYTLKLLYGVDGQRLDRLLDSRDSTLISCFFFAHEVHDFYRILIHHMLGVQNARSSDHA